MNAAKELALAELHETEAKLTDLRAKLTQHRSRYSAFVDGGKRIIGIEPEKYIATERELFQQLDVATRAFHERLATWAQAQ
jgi:hypothetical protein